MKLTQVNKNNSFLSVVEHTYPILRLWHIIDSEDREHEDLQDELLMLLSTVSLCNYCKITYEDNTVKVDLAKDKKLEKKLQFKIHDIHNVQVTYNTYNFAEHIWNNDIKHIITRWLLAPLPVFQTVTEVMNS